MTENNPISKLVSKILGIEPQKAADTINKNPVINQESTCDNLVRIQSRLDCKPSEHDVKFLNEFKKLVVEDDSMEKIWQENKETIYGDIPHLDFTKGIEGIIELTSFSNISSKIIQDLNSLLKNIVNDYNNYSKERKTDPWLINDWAFSLNLSTNSSIE